MPQLSITKEQGYTALFPPIIQNTANEGSTRSASMHYQSTD